jgi:hypothetical protein
MILGAQFEYLTLAPKETERGTMHGHVHFEDFDAVPTDRRVTILLAGPLAQRRYSPKSIMWLWGGRYDFMDAAALIHQLDGSNVDFFDASSGLPSRNTWWVAAEAMVNMNMSRITRVARELVKHGGLDYPAVKRLARLQFTAPGR